MDNNFTNTEKLIRYLDGELNEAEKQDIQNDLRNDVALQQEMENLQLAKSAVINYGLNQKVSSLHQTMMQEINTPSKPVVRSLPKMMMRIAAGIILAVGLLGLYQYFTVSPDSLYNNQYTAYETPTMRSTTSASNLEKAYKEKKYDTVIALYAQTVNPAANDQFLAAQSYIAIADYYHAIILFNTLIDKNKATGASTLNDDAEYYLALSYLKNKEVVKALPLFEKIHDDKAHLYHNKVSSWYLAKVKLLSWKN